LTKSLSCNVAVVNKVTVLFRISSLSELISIKIERALLWQVQCHKHQEGNFKSSRKILRNWQHRKSRIPCFHPNGPVMRSDALQCLEDSDKFNVASVWTSKQYIQTLFSVQEDSSFSLQTRIGKHSLQPSERGFNIETCEVHYGKAVVQFTVWMLYASVRTPPREIQNSSDLGFLSL